jgi:chromosome segregation ATPase
MRTKTYLKIAAIFLTASVATAEEQDAEAKFREALRSTMMQLREAQAKTAEMEAASVQAQMEADKAKKQVASLQSQMLDERNASANQITELRSAVEQRNERITGFEAQIAKWEKDYAAMVEKARQAEFANAQAKGRIATLERTVKEQQIKNIEMKQTAEEILDRYAATSLGTSVLAREPFIGVNRAKLQTLMQDLETRVRASTLQP